MKKMLFHVSLIAIMLITVTFLKGGVSFALDNLDMTSAYDQPLEWEAFSEAVAFMNKEYSNKVVKDSLDDAYASGRIIVKVTEDFPDIADFCPVMVVRDTENHYLLQFLSSSEAEACAAFLQEQPTVEYVEADLYVSIDPGLEADSPR